MSAITRIASQKQIETFTRTLVSFSHCQRHAGRTPNMRIHNTSNSGSLCSSTLPFQQLSFVSSPLALNKVQEQMYVLVNLLTKLPALYNVQAPPPPGILLTPPWGGVHTPVRNHSFKTNQALVTSRPNV